MPEQIKDRLIDIVNSGLDDGDGPVAIVDKVLDCLAAADIFAAFPVARLEGPDQVMPMPSAFPEAWVEMVGYIKTRRDIPT